MHKPYLKAGVKALALAGLITLPLMANADISRGQILASTCFACHGTDGKSPGSVPMIHGYSADVLVRLLKGFRDDSRAATVMNRHAKGYTDEEIKLLSEYIGSLN
jgi:sulfide dehydrogenase cytochrome subunit